jgi:hypothetical protein
LRRQPSRSDAPRGVRAPSFASFPPPPGLDRHHLHLSGVGAPFVRVRVGRTANISSTLRGLRGSYAWFQKNGNRHFYETAVLNPSNPAGMGSTAVHRVLLRRRS